MREKDMEKNKKQSIDDNLEDLVDEDDEIKESDRRLYRILLQPPRRILSGELIPNPNLSEETVAFIEKKKAELNVDDWPPKYRGWVPSDALVEEFMQFGKEWRAQKKGKDN